MRHVRLDHLIGTFAVGSGEWSWQEEHDKLFERDYQRQLTDRIRVEGIREPVLLGSDGRVWDGHHRVCSALHLGIDSIPVEFVSEDRAEVERAAAEKAWDEGYGACWTYHTSEGLQGATENPFKVSS